MTDALDPRKVAAFTSSRRGSFKLYLHRGGQGAASFVRFHEGRNTLEQLKASLSCPSHAKAGITDELAKCIMGAPGYERLAVAKVLVPEQALPERRPRPAAAVTTATVLAAAGGQPPAPPLAPPPTPGPATVAPTHPLAQPPAPPPAITDDAAAERLQPTPWRPGDNKATLVAALRSRGITDVPADATNAELTEALRGWDGAHAEREVDSQRET